MLHPLPRYFGRERRSSFGETSSKCIRNDKGPSVGPSKLGRWPDSDAFLGFVLECQRLAVPGANFLLPEVVRTGLGSAG